MVGVEAAPALCRTSDLAGLLCSHSFEGQTQHWLCGYREKSLFPVGMVPVMHGELHNENKVPSLKRPHGPPERFLGTAAYSPTSTLERR